MNPIILILIATIPFIVFVALSKLSVQKSVSNKKSNISELMMAFACANSDGQRSRLKKRLNEYFEESLSLYQRLYKEELIQDQMPVLHLVKACEEFLDETQNMNKEKREKHQAFIKQASILVAMIQYKACEFSELDDEMMKLEDQAILKSEQTIVHLLHEMAMQATLIGQDEQTVRMWGLVA